MHVASLHREERNRVTPIEFWALSSWGVSFISSDITIRPNGFALGALYDFRGRFVVSNVYLDLTG